MTVTSIYGPETASCEVIINNRNCEAESELGPPEPPASERSPSVCSHTSGFDERSLDSAVHSPLRNEETSLDVESCPVTDTPLPDLEEVSMLMRDVEVEAETDNELEMEEEV